MIEADKRKRHAFPFSAKQKRDNDILIREDVERTIDDEIASMSPDEKMRSMREFYELKTKGKLAKLEADISTAFAEPEPPSNHGRASGLMGIFVWKEDSPEHDKWLEKSKRHDERRGRMRAELHDLLNNPHRQDGIQGCAKGWRESLLQERVELEGMAGQIKTELGEELERLKARTDPIDAERPTTMSHVYANQTKPDRTRPTRPKPH